MKKLIIACFIICSPIAWGQYDMDEANKKDKEKNVNWFELKQRIYVGGELGLSFNSQSTFINTAPIIGYELTDRFSVGLSTMYQLWRFRDYFNVYNFHTYGGGLFARLRPVEPLILQIESNLYNTNDFYDGTLDRVWVPAIMAGIGYAQPLGGRSYYQIMLMYDFVNDPNMPLPPLIFEPLHFRMGLVWYLGD